MNSWVERAAAILRHFDPCQIDLAWITSQTYFEKYVCEVFIGLLFFLIFACLLLCGHRYKYMCICMLMKIMVSCSPSLLVLMLFCQSPPKGGLEGEVTGKSTS